MILCRCLLHDRVSVVEEARRSVVAHPSLRLLIIYTPLPDVSAYRHEEVWKSSVSADVSNTRAPGDKAQRWTAQDIAFPFVSRRPPSSANLGMHCAHDDCLQQPDEETALLGSPERKVSKGPTPLPRLQIFILLLMQLAEPITSNCLYPFINQVRSFVVCVLVRAYRPRC